MKKIELIVLDMAGTTVEDNDAVHHALIEAFQLDHKTIDRNTANQVMGIPKPIAINQILNEQFSINDASLVNKIHLDFKHLMIRHYRESPAVKPALHAEDLFRTLKSKGLKIYLDTGFSRDIADCIIQRFNWMELHLIDGSITSDEVERGRPFPDMIHRIMEISGVKDASLVAKVGDTGSDLQEGTAANCGLVIGITSGAFSTEQLKDFPHTHLVTDLMEINDLIAPVNS